MKLARLLLTCLICAMALALYAGCQKKVEPPQAEVKAPAPRIILESIEVRPADTSKKASLAEIGSTARYTAMGHFSDGSTSDISGKVTWSTSDPLIATVNGDGMVVFIASGSVRIIATDIQSGIKSEDSKGSQKVNVLITSITVRPLYAKHGANWNDYVKNNGPDKYRASGAACPATGDGYSTCIHAGELRAVNVPGAASCDGLSARDSLGAFTWVCKTGPKGVSMVSSGFREKVSLSDLIDFKAAAWKANSVTVTLKSEPILMTKKDKWWGNEVIEDSDGSDGSQMKQGQIYIAKQGASGAYAIGADRIALLIKPGAELKGSVFADGRKFLWIEGAVNAQGLAGGMQFRNIGFCMINRASVSQSSGDGIYLLSSKANMISRVSVSQSDDGIYLHSSSNNTLNDINADGNTHTGVSLYASSNNTLEGITATGNGFGVYIVSSLNNRLSSISASRNSDGVYISSSHKNRIDGLEMDHNSYAGLRIYLSSGNTLRGLVARDNHYGAFLILSSGNNLGAITASGNGNGLLLSESMNNSFSDLSIDNNNFYGVFLTGSSNNTLLNLHASNNLTYDVNLDKSPDNMITGKYRVGHNTAEGIVIKKD